MNATTTACPNCGAPATGNFCSTCGTPVREAVCSGCGATLPAGAGFCRGCGRRAGAGTGPAPGTRGAGERRPWIVAGATMAGLLALLLFTVARREGGPPAPSPVPDGPMAAGSPPDISSLTPRERFDRLYQRVLQASQTGDTVTARRFTPMALAAYQMLDSVDTDVRYHAAVLRVHTGDPDAAKALGDSIVKSDPDHLFGYMALGTSARWRKDPGALRQAYRSFLARYDAEMKAARAEYAEHRFSVEEFRKAAVRDSVSPP